MNSKPKSKRLVALDLLRGFFLLVIIIDHVELFPSLFDLISGRGQLWVSAAEGFFFISGLLVGYIYRRKIGEGMKYVFKKLWSRAALLYFWAVVLTLLYTWWAFTTGNPNGVKYGAAPALDWSLVWNTLRLNYVYGWSDFLTYYVVFMLAAPFVFYALKKKLWWLVVILSAVVWFNRGGRFELAWQVLFFGGMIVGYHWDQINLRIQNWSDRRRRYVWRTVVAMAVVTFAISYANRFVLGFFDDKIAMLPHDFGQFITNWSAVNESLWPFFQKWTLEPGRILMFGLWFAAGYLLVSRYAVLIPHAVSRFLNLLGRNSLYVYGVHSVLVFAIHAYLPKTLGVVFNFTVTAMTIAAVAGLVVLKDWYRQQVAKPYAGAVKDGLRLAYSKIQVRD